MTSRQLSEQQQQTAPPCSCLILPWGWWAQLGLPDHLRCTYELILALAHDHDGRRTRLVTRRQLAAWRGVALRTLDDHLAALRDRGLLASEDEGHGRGLVYWPLDLPAVADGDQALEAGPCGTPSPTPATLRSPARPTLRLDCPAGDDLRARSRQDRGRGPPQHVRPLLEEERILSQTGVDDLLLANAEAGDDTRLEAEPLSSAEPPSEAHLVACVARLEDAGVYAGLSQEIARLTWVTPDLIDAWVWQLRQQRRVRRLGAVLATVLRDPNRCFPAPAPPSAQVRDAAQEEALDPPRSSPDPPLPFDWAAWLAVLRDALGDQPVDLWLQEAYPLSYADGVLVVAITAPYGADWLSHQRQRDLDATASGLAGVDLKVRLVTAGRR